MKKNFFKKAEDLKLCSTREVQPAVLWAWLRKDAPLTQPSALARVDLPQLDAFLQARGGHGALAEVRLPVAGAERLAARGARLGQADQEGPAGESLHPAERAQAVFAVFARICRDTDAVGPQLQSSSIRDTENN